MTEEKQALENNINPWKTATVVLGITAIVLIGSTFQLMESNSEKYQVSNLVKVASEDGNKPIQICTLDKKQCLPLLQFKQVQGEGVCKVPNPTCDLFKRLNLVK